MQVLTPSACCATLCAITSRRDHFALFRAYVGNGVNPNPNARETTRKHCFSRFTRFHAGPFTRDHADSEEVRLESHL